MANERRLHQNFIGGLINEALTDVSTSLVSGALPAVIEVDASSHLAVVLDPDGAYGEPEIVWVTSHAATAGTATVLRGREGTTARAHRVDIPWVLSFTSYDLEVVRAAPVRAVTASDSMTSKDGVILANGLVTVTLPAIAASLPGRTYTVKNIGVDAVTVAPASGTIDGAVSVALATQYSSVSAVHDGTNWHVI